MKGTVLVGSGWLLLLLGLWGPLPAQEPDARLRISPASGEPGEEVAVEFRGDISHPLAAFIIIFDLPPEAAEFIRTEVSGTASSHARPQDVIYNPRFFQGGYLTGVRFNTGTGWVPLAAGDGLLLVKAVFRIRADATAGDYSVEVKRTEFSPTPSIRKLTVAVEGQGILTVKPPAGPRPVGDLRCSQFRDEAVLKWQLTEAYDAIEVSRDGVHVATLPGSAASYRDRPPVGPVSYSVRGLRSGKSSFTARCSLLVDVLRPAPIAGFSCSPDGGEVSLSWVNGEVYESVALFRNGSLIAELPGSLQFYRDTFGSPLFTVYSAKGRAGGIETVPGTCKLNEFSEVFVIWAEEVRAAPGESRVPVRFFATNPRPVQGIEICFRVSPENVILRELSVLGTMTEAQDFEFFGYQTGVLDRGETAAGIIFEASSDAGKQLPAGSDQHVLTAFVEIRDEALDGTIVPVKIGRFGNPVTQSVFSIPIGISVSPELRAGAILIGRSPVPEVENAGAEEAPATGGGASGAVEGIRLSWSNPAGYDGIRIERGGKSIAALAGSATSYLDGDPGPGVHRYRIIASRGARESFPVVVAALPRGVPGTFRRGDANSDRRVDIADAITIIGYLFLGSSSPHCLDAADADDSGALDIGDSISIISYLFLGTEPLPLPGIQVPWFDPTPDRLSCE